MSEQPFAYNQDEIIYHRLKSLNNHSQEDFFLNECGFRFMPRLQRLVPWDRLEEISGYLAEDVDLVQFVECPVSTSRKCDYCSASMTSDIEEDDFEAGYTYSFFLGLEDQYDNRHRDLYRCPECGWWCLEVSLTRNTGDMIAFSKTDRYLAQGVLRHFDVSAPDAALEDLVSWLKRDNQSISEIDPYRFEDLVASCLENIFGKNEVRKIGGRADRGIDILISESAGEKIIVQVKRRSNIDKAESVAVVRSLNGVLLRERIPHGMVVTTSRLFTTQARREIEDTRKNYLRGEFSRYRVDLVTFDQIMGMIEQSPLDTEVIFKHLDPHHYDAWRARFDPGYQDREFPDAQHI